MKPPIIFLDVDGVLNRCGKSRERLERPLLRRLGQIVVATDAKIVISSTWRTLPLCMEYLLPMLPLFGVDVIGQTPDLASQKFGGLIWAASVRGDEIAAWLRDNPGHDRFVILDDDADMGEQLPHLIRTNSYEGLQDEHVEQAIRMLKGGDAQCPTHTQQNTAPHH